MILYSISSVTNKQTSINVLYRRCMFKNLISLLIHKNKNKSIVETTIANQSGSDGYGPLHLCWFRAVGQLNT